MRILIIKDKNLTSRQPEFDSVLEKIKSEYAIATKVSWKYGDFDFSGAKWIPYNNDPNTLGLDVEFIKQKLNEIYTEHNLAYDHVVFLVSPENWKNGGTGIGGWALGVAYGNYAAEIVKAITNPVWLKNFFEMELAHNLEDLIYLELGIDLNKILNLSYDLSVVHGESPNWGVKQPDGTYFTDYNYDKLISTFQTYISQMYQKRETKYQDFMDGLKTKISLLEKLIITYRQLILLLGSRPKAIPEELERSNHFKHNMEKYDFKTGLLKALKYFILFLLPVLVDKFIVSYPEIAQLSIGAGLVWLVNLAKVKYGVKLP